MPRDVQLPDEILGFSFVEYLTIFVGLIFALAVAEFFLSIGQIIKARKRVKIYWEFIIWLIVILDFFIISWYVYWPRLAYLNESLLNYFVLILPYLIIFIIVSVYFPELRKKKEIDLKIHFLENRRPFFLLFSIYLFLNIMIDIFLPTEATLFAVITQSLYLILCLANTVYNILSLRIAGFVLFGIHLFVVLIYI